MSKIDNYITQSITIIFNCVIYIDVKEWGKGQGGSGHLDSYLYSVSLG